MDRSTQDRVVQTGRELLLAASGVGLALATGAGLSRLRQANLEGQVALVTGGSRGLGFLLARGLARQGCPVAICARDREELERARQELEREGADVFADTCDITDRFQVERLVQRVSDHFGRIDILVNNAGIISVGPVLAMTVEDFREAMDIMYWGMVYCSLAVLPQMLERRSGRIVNITSIGGKVSVPHLLPYAGAKFAAVGFSEGLTAELARENIQVTTIVPGLMRTGSDVNALFKGKQSREFTLFSLLAGLPVSSMDAERAAGQIIEALRRGDPERTLSVPATLAALVHGVLPGSTIRALALVNRFLPSADGSPSEALHGRTIEQQSPSRLRATLTAFNRSASRRFNELSGADDRS